MNASESGTDTNPWPSLLAFVGGIAIAWWTGWDTRTLVWSLWLSSLVVGFLSILIGVVATMRDTRTALRNGLADTSPDASATLARLSLPLSLLYGALLLAFFVVHFGGFHWGHSIFLDMYFPIDGSERGSRGSMPRLADYLQIIREAWWFVPLALVAERSRLLTARPRTKAGSVHRVEPDERIAAPYRNVMRLHLLIFVFAFAMFAGIDGIWIYLVVYAAYFFPWSSLRRKPA